LHYYYLRVKFVTFIVCFLVRVNPGLYLPDDRVYDPSQKDNYRFRSATWN